MLRLPGLVALSWAAWVGGIVLLYVLYRARVMHPHFLPLTVLLGLQLILAGAIVIGGLWRFARGRDRLRAAACLLIGSGPLWLWAIHVSYCLWKKDARQVEFNLALKTGAVLAASVADLAARIQYPYRHEGVRVVMWSDRGEGGGKDVAAMDQHVARLEGILGRKCRAKVHWVRGSLLGFYGGECMGLALGSEPGHRQWLADELAPNDDLASQMDRHEVAHFVINHLCGPDAEPPMILVEGWAEANSGCEPVYLAERAWRLKEEGAALGIGELTAHQFHGRPLEPMYFYGGAMVDFLLRRYGGEKFLELYSTCRRKTFPDDFRRVLGVSMEEFDRAFWSDVDRQMNSVERAARRNPLASARLETGVEVNLWKELATQHPAALAKARKLFGRSRITTETTFRRFPEVSPSAGANRPTRVLEILRDGEHGRVVLRDSIFGVSVTIATPGCSGSWLKTGEGVGWKDIGIDRTGLSNYDLVTHRRGIDWWMEECLGISYLPLANRPFRGIIGPELTVVQLERNESEGRRLWRVEFDASLPRLGGRERRSGWFVVSPDANWAIQSYEVHYTPPNLPSQTERASIQYGSARDGVPIISEYCVERLDSSSKLVSGRTTKLTRCEFAPSPLEDFKPEAFGLESSSLESPAGVPWSVVVTAVGCIASPTLGLALLAVLWRRRPRVPIAPASTS